MRRACRPARPGTRAREGRSPWGRHTGRPRNWATVPPVQSSKTAGPKACRQTCSGDVSVDEDAVPPEPVARDPEAAVADCAPVPVMLPLALHPAIRIAAAVPARMATFRMLLMATRRRGMADLFRYRAGLSTAA